MSTASSFPSPATRLHPRLRSRGRDVVRRRPAIAGALILVAQLMLILDATVVQVASPKIHAALHFSSTSLLWVINGYVLPYGGLLLMGGRLGDVRGRRWTFRVGLAIFTGASALAGLAPTALTLILARVAQGVGAALTAPSVLALLTTSAPDERARQRAFALFAAVSGGGLSLGLLLGGLIVQLASWRWTMLINLPLGITVLALVPHFVTETERQPARFDLVGSLTATLGTTALVWALVNAPEHGWISWQTSGAIAAALILLVAFTLTERRAVDPMVSPALLRNRTRTAALFANLFVIAAQMATFYFSVQFMQEHLRMGPLPTGLGFLPMSAAMFAGSRMVPRLIERLGAHLLMVTGTTLQTGGLILLAVRADGTGGYWTTVFAPLLLDGIALGIVLAPITATAMRNTPADRAGSLSGLFQTTQQFGAAIGVALSVTIYAAHAAPGRFLPGVSYAFATAALLAALGLTSVLATRPSRRPAR